MAMYQRPDLRQFRQDMLVDDIPRLNSFGNSIERAPMGVPLQQQAPSNPMLQTQVAPTPDTGDMGLGNRIAPFTDQVTNPNAQMATPADVQQQTQEQLSDLEMQKPSNAERLFQIIDAVSTDDPQDQPIPGPIQRYKPSGNYGRISNRLFQNR